MLRFKRPLLQQLEKRGISLENKRLIVAFSGGADSVFLLLLLQALQKECSLLLHAVHVEHGIRGEESRADAQFCRDFCQERGISCSVHAIDIPKRMETEKGSVEEVARRERYAILHREKEALGYDWIVTAHHRRDQAETILFSLFRGSALHGLTGMRLLEKDLFRPLLLFSPDDMRKTLLAEGITWREDSTNEDLTYTRNRIRKEILPLLAKCNAKAESHIVSAGERLLELEEYLKEQTEEAYARCVRDDGALSVEGFRSLPSVIRRELLITWLERSGCGRKDIGQSHLFTMEEALLSEEAAGIDLPGTYALTKTRQGKTAGLTRKQPEDKKAVPVQVLREEMLRKGVTVRGEDRDLYLCLRDADPEKYEKNEQNPYTKRMDYDTIKGRLLLRTRNEGDYLVIHPDGRRKKLARYFLEEKTDRLLRDSILLLVEEEEREEHAKGKVLWIPGMRTSECCRISAKTTRVLELTIKTKQ